MKAPISASRWTPYTGSSGGRTGFTSILAANAAAAIVAADERQVDAFILDRQLLDDQPGLEMLAWLRHHPRYRLPPVLS